VSLPASYEKFVILRRMTYDDLPTVIAIEQLSFSNPWQESTFRGEIQNRPFSYPYVIVQDVTKRVMGYIIFWQIKDEVQINNLAVLPDYKRIGVGETALRQVIEEVAARGVTFVSLEVRTSNLPAVSLYRKLGFRTLGVRKNYYSNPVEDAYVMGLNLP